MGLSEAYREAKALLLESVGPPDDPRWSQPVPATPEWTVLEVVAHVTGLAAEAAGGTLPGDLNLLEQFRDPVVIAARDEFADGQVHRRRGVTPDEIVAEWDQVEGQLLTRLERESGDPEALPFGFDVVLTTDLAVHSDDVALALGQRPHVGSAAARVAMAGYRFGLAYRLDALGLPALALRYDGKEQMVGTGAPAASVTADRWELLRVLAGRRSTSQIRSLDWDGDPAPYLPLLPAYGERATDLAELP